MSKWVPAVPEAHAKAKELTKGLIGGKAKDDAITEYVRKNFAYDYIRAIKIPKRNVYPDPVYCWKNKMGICQDIAALTVRMLRVVGVDARLCIGYADGKYHAWTEAYIAGKTYRFDHPAEAKSYKAERMYRS